MVRYERIAAVYTKSYRGESFGKEEKRGTRMERIERRNIILINFLR